MKRARWEKCVAKRDVGPKLARGLIVHCHLSPAEEMHGEHGQCASASLEIVDCRVRFTCFSYDGSPDRHGLFELLQQVHPSNAKSTAVIRYTDESCFPQVSETETLPHVAMEFLDLV